MEVKIGEKRIIRKSNVKTGRLADLKGHLLLQRAQWCVCVCGKPIKDQVVKQFSSSVLLWCSVLFLMHCQVQQEHLILIVRVYNRACTCTHIALLGKGNNITTLKALPCFILLKWVYRAYRTSFLPVHDTYNSFKHYIIFLSFVLFRSSAAPRVFLYFCSLFWSAVERGSHSYDNLFPVNFKPVHMPISALCANGCYL